MEVFKNIHNGKLDSNNSGKNVSKSLKLGGAHEGVFGDADEHLADVLPAEEGAEGRDEGLETVSRDRGDEKQERSQGRIHGTRWVGPDHSAP